MRHSLRLPGVLRVALVAGAALLAAACSDDSSDGTTDPGPSGAKTITATLAASGEFTTLTAALEAADLDGTLAGAGPFTLFAPTDAAFAKLPAGTVEGLLADIPALTRVLQYHVTSGEVDAAAVSASASVATLLGVAVPVMVEADGTVVLNGAAAVTSADVVASNGVIHVIDTVLLPPDDPPPSNTITDIVTSDDRFETLATAVAAAGLGDTLAGDGPFTVFAPTDDAFAALPAGTLDTLLADQAALTDVLTYHVVDGEVTASQVVGLSEAVAKNGVAIGIEVVDGAVVLNGTVHVTITDIVADNGVIHVIDGVLVPPPTIAELVATDPDFSTLRAAVEAAGLGEALAGDGPFTVFAPTDAAFAKIPEADLQALLADKAALTDVLTYHALTGRHLAAEVTGVTYLTMLNGAIAPIAVSDGARIAGASIVATDVRARNGVVHVIDTVITPPPTIAAIVAGDDRFETLLTAVQAAGLADTLTTGGPFTVFAPTDDAFALVDAGALQALLADTAALTDVLLYHVIDGVVPAAVAVTLSEATMKSGDQIGIAVDGGAVVLNAEAEVVATDVWARNGVIHVIDHVLMPPSP